MAELSETSIEFRCPTCGGDRWRTSRNHDGIEIGYCRNGIGGCFQWPRTEDWKVFKLIEVYYFRDKADYEKAREANP